MQLDNYTFNFEEFGRYTDMYEKARDIDQENSKNFYKLVKYLRLSTEE